MIVIACHPRTGSSVLVKCLEKSGYNLGQPLNGHCYKSEYVPMLMLNRLIFQKFPLDWNKGKILYDEVAEKDPYVLDLIRRLAQKLHTDKVDVVKDTQFAVVADIYHRTSKMFRGAKYIYLERNLRETAKSEVRQQHKTYTHLPKMTVLQAEDRYRFHMKAWKEFLPSVYHIKIDYSDLINTPGAAGEKLSGFLGRDIDMSLINPKKTYAASGKIY